MEIGWIDYSESARQTTLQILDALKERQAIDELGIGIVRDALADRLFPATSTLLTRAKYFFLVPYALRDLERSHDANKSANQLRLEYDDTEKNLAIKLLQTTESKEGIFGNRSLRADFSGSWVKRGPGVVYWAPLRTLGILKDARMGYAEYFGAVAQMPGNARQVKRSGDDDGLADDAAARASYWNIPNSEYRDWEKRLGIELTQQEAAFLKDRIAERCPGSLYALLASDPGLRETANGIAEQMAAQDGGTIANAFHLFCGQALPQLPQELSELCKLGIGFSNFVYGCRIRYNAQIPSQAEQADLLWADYGPDMGEYAEALDVERLYGVLRMARHSGAGPLRKFLLEARECMAEGDVAGLDEAVRLREARIKGARAKIGREPQEGDPWIGGALLSYRYEVGWGIIGEIEAAGGFDA